MITGYKIRLARQLKGIAAKAVADEMDLDYSTYSRIERGQTKLTEDRVELILKALQTDRATVENIENINMVKALPNNPTIETTLIALQQTLDRNKLVIDQLLIVMMQMQRK